MTETVALAWSGGKDCTQALAHLRTDPAIRIVTLVVALGENEKRISMHGIREDLLDRQAEALGLPLVKVWLPPRADNATYCARFATVLKPLISKGLDGIAFGDIALADVRSFREAQMRELGIRTYFPLWGEASTTLATRFIVEGYRAVLCCVDAEQLDPAFLGREFDAALLAELPAAVDPCGENGEFHSFVHAGPIFGHSLTFTRGQRHVSNGRFHFLDLLPRPV